jgi:hypothetical protein
VTGWAARVWRCLTRDLRYLTRERPGLWLRVVANTWRNRHVEESEGCCTCGAPSADWEYRGACDTAALGLDPGAPDWAQCQACHHRSGRGGAWMRALPHAPIPCGPDPATRALGLAPIPQTDPPVTAIDGRPGHQDRTTPARALAARRRRRHGQVAVIALGVAVTAGAGTVLA